MAYKFFTNKHGFIGERAGARHEIRLRGEPQGGFDQATLLRKRGYFGWVSNENPEQATSSEMSYEMRECEVRGCEVGG